MVNPNNRSTWLKHECDGLKTAPFTVENRGGGWYLWTLDSRGTNSIRFCPCCGQKVVKDCEKG